LLFSPQINNQAGSLFDTLAWKLVSGDFMAAGGENYLIIGNHKNDANTDTVLLNTFGLGTCVFIDDVSLIVTPCTGIDEENINSRITIYPNPFSDKLNISNSKKEQVEIILYEITSGKILQQKFMNSDSLNTIELEKGIYLYEVRNKSGMIKKGKVVKD
jgi:type IX secretion system substrate protein